MWWTKYIDKGIALSKFRIKHHEKHGCGNNAIRDKDTLKKQERARQLRRDN